MNSNSSNSLGHNSGKITISRPKQMYLAGFSVVASEYIKHGNYQTILHEQELLRANQFQHDKRKIGYLLGRSAAKMAINQICHQPMNSIFIDSGVFEFPAVNYIQESSIQVSISHCDDIGISIAFPEVHPLAIDLEIVNPSTSQHIAYHLTPAEQDILKTLNLQNDNGYVLSWTIKESLSKILRTGLMIDFSVLEIESINRHETIWESNFVHCPQFKALSYYCYNYFLTIVCPKNSEPNLANLLRIFTNMLEYNSSHRPIF